MMNNLHPIRDYIVPGKRAHLVGIGGVSMCPLAEGLRGMGLHVQGSDMTERASPSPSATTPTTWATATW